MPGDLPDHDIPVFFLYVDDMAVPPLGLTAVECLVDQLKKAVVVCRILRINGTTDGSGDKRIAFLQLNILPEDFTIIHSDKEGLVCVIGHIAQVNDQKLISAETSGQSKARQICCQVLGNMNQHLITDMVSIGIVDEFEIIQIQHRKGERYSLLDQPLGEPQNMPTGNQTCQLVQQAVRSGFLQFFREVRVLYQFFLCIHSDSPQSD